MNDQAPAAYRLLYSRGTAAFLVLLAGLVMAVSQTHVIRDWLATLHPNWSPTWLWLNAAGFELVVLSVGLVLSMSPTRKLWAMELFLVGVSCAAAWDYGHAGHSPVRALLGSLMPLQYLAAVLAGHELAAGQRRAARRVPDTATKAPDIAGTVRTESRTGAAVSGRAAAARTAPDKAKALELLRSGQSPADVAAKMGVHERSVRRWRTGGYKVEADNSLLDPA